MLKNIILESPWEWRKKWISPQRLPCQDAKMHLVVEPFTHFWHQKTKMVMVKTLMLRLWNRESRNQWWCVMVAIYLLYTVCAVDSCSFYFLLGLKNICHGPCVYLAGSLLATLLLFSSLYLSRSLLILLSAWVEHIVDSCHRPTHLAWLSTCCCSLTQFSCHYLRQWLRASHPWIVELSEFVFLAYS